MTVVMFWTKGIFSPLMMSTPWLYFTTNVYQPEQPYSYHTSQHLAHPRRRSISASMERALGIAAAMKGNVIELTKGICRLAFESTR